MLRSMKIRCDLELLKTHVSVINIFGQFLFLNFLATDVVISWTNAGGWCCLDMHEKI
jgi:hypothetical protein